MYVVCTSYMYMYIVHSSFNCSTFCHLVHVHVHVHKVNENWYPGRAIIKCLRYQIQLTSCTKWWNDDRLNVIDQNFAGKYYFR